MSDRPPHEETPALDQYLDAFGAQLAAAIADEAATEPAPMHPVPPETAPVPRRRRQRGFRIASVGIATLATVAAAIVLLPIVPSPGPSDPVAGARAAFGKPGMILHYVVTSESRTPDEGEPNAACTPGPMEIWQSTAGAPRYRMRNPAIDPKCGGLVLADGTVVTGPTEMASAPGRRTQYYPELKRMSVETGISAAGPGGPASLDPADESGAGELITGLRNMFRKGRLRESRRAVENGRRVVYLVGTAHRTKGQNADYTLEYIVDASSYAPISLKRRTVYHVGTGRGRPKKGLLEMSNTWHFLSYEQLPVTTANEKLLTITPTGPVTVTTQTAAQANAAAKRRWARESAEASARYRARKARGK